MTSFEPIPVPLDLGQCLAYPGAYLEPPAGLATPAPRVRRHRRPRRKLATLAAVVAAAGLAVTGRSAGTRVAQRPVWDGTMRETRNRGRHSFRVAS